jgi:tetratricopeptide (TPR) repeat protein
MLSPVTAESARQWYETGVRRIESESIGIAITHLERAIAVFDETGDRAHSTWARHYKLLGLTLDTRYEEAEGHFATVMQGYTEQGDTYGQALLLCHLADGQAAQGRWERAHSLYNLAGVVAENDRHGEVLTHVLLRQGQLCRERDNLTQAVKLFHRAERLVEHEDPPHRLTQFRFLRAQVLSLLGETGEAIALLEDVQAHLVSTHQSQAAMEPLNLLRRLYEDQGLTEERSRVSRLMNLSGQRMIQTDLLPRPIVHLGPPIDRTL